MTGTGATDEPTGLKGEVAVLEPNRLERSLIRHAAEARATVPDVDLSTDVEAGAALALADRAGSSLRAVLVAACAAALREHPRANAAYRDGRFELYSRANVAVTVPAPEGSLNPVILDADRKPLEQLEAELATLSARAERGELTSPDLAGATFTLTDLTGSRIHRATPLLQPPQAAALVAGGLREAPVIAQGQPARGQLLTLTLAADGRILSGLLAAAFLETIGDRLTLPGR